MSLSKQKALTPTTASKEMSGEDNPGQSTNSKGISDLPPEVMMKIFEFLTLEASRSTILKYRLVQSTWKEFMDNLIEKRIISTQFPFLARTGLIVEVEELLHVFFSQEHVFDSANQNHLPFNALILRGSGSSQDLNNHPQALISLPVFVTEFGGNLTSLALHDNEFSIKNFLTILNAFSNLKILNLEDVELVPSEVKKGAVLPAPPGLSNLTTLKVGSVFVGNARRNRNILYIWMICSYADKLQRLVVHTSEPLPPFQASHQYTHSFQDNPNQDMQIAATSEFAFGKLKELQISRPTCQFFEQSNLLVLQKLTVISNGGRMGAAHVRDLRRLMSGAPLIPTPMPRLTILEIKSNATEREQNDGRNVLCIWFIASYAHQLVRLNLDCWDGMPALEPSQDYFHQVGGINQFFIASTTALAFEHLEELKIRNPTSQFLEFSQTPSLKSLEVNGLGESTHFRHLNEFIENCAETLEELVLNLTWNTFVDYAGYLRVDALAASNTVKSLAIHYPRSEVEEITLRETFLVAFPSLERLKLLHTHIGRNEDEEAGSNQEMVKASVEKILNRRGIWQTCPNLKFVSASSGENAAWDICQITRPEEF